VAVFNDDDEKVVNTHESFLSPNNNKLEGIVLFVVLLGKRISKQAQGGNQQQIV
jgi:hypothetical protein